MSILFCSSSVVWWLSLLLLLLCKPIPAAWVLANANTNCNTACQSVGSSCLTNPMNAIDTPAEVYAIDGRIGITCDAVEDLSLTTNGDVFTTLPQLELRSSNTFLCQFSRSGLAADCAAMPESGGLQRICCCGSSDSDCTAEELDPSDEPNPLAGTPLKPMILTIGGVIGLLLGVLGLFAGIFGIGVWVGTGSD